MPGLLSSIFDPGTDDGTSVQQSENSIAADAGHELAVDQQVGIDVGVAYQDADGGTHGIALENDVALTLDASATAQALLTTEDSASTQAG